MEAEPWTIEIACTADDMKRGDGWRNYLTLRTVGRKAVVGIEFIHGTGWLVNGGYQLVAVPNDAASLHPWVSIILGSDAAVQDLASRLARNDKPILDYYVYGPIESLIDALGYVKGTDYPAYWSASNWYQCQPPEFPADFGGSDMEFWELAGRERIAAMPHLLTHDDLEAELRWHWQRLLAAKQET